MSLALFAVTLMLLAAASLRDGHAPVAASEAETAAFRWVGVGVAEKPRRREDRWEVDVVRPDGSLVEVTLGERLQLQELDEELGPGGSPAHDDVRGPIRRRAIRRALVVAGPGRVLSVERDRGGEREVYEVDIRRPGGNGVEVGLDAKLRVVEIEPQDLGDE